MQRPNQLHSWVNLADLKAQLVKRLGQDRTKVYFYYLNRLLNLKLSKAEFNKFCLRVIGRENIKLHNQLIRSILKNTCNAKVRSSALIRDEDGLEFTSDGYRKNEDVLLSSPWGTRSGIAVGSDGKVDVSSSQQSTITNNKVVSENGDSDSHEIKKLVQHHQVISNKSNNEVEVGLCHHAKIKGPAESVISVDTNEQSEALIDRDGKELSTRSSLKAPLGIPLCSFSVGGACQTPHLASSDGCFSSYDSGELLDTEMLKERMQQIAAAQGIEGVSLDSANLLNRGLNVYLERLIRSSIELGGTRCGRDLVGNNIHKHHSPDRLVNGQSSSCPSAEMPKLGHHLPLYLLDFKAAMWLKPQQLGENWPLLLEKICAHSHEE